MEIKPNYRMFARIVHELRIYASLFKLSMFARITHELSRICAKVKKGFQLPVKVHSTSFRIQISRVIVPHMYFLEKLSMSN